MQCAIKRVNEADLLLWTLQVTKYVEREIQNHRTLMHPHIVQFKEVGCCAFPHEVRPLTHVHMLICKCCRHKSTA